MIYWLITTFISPVSGALIVLGALGLFLISFPLISQYLPPVSATPIKILCILLLTIGSWALGSSTEKDKYTLELEKQKVYIAELENNANKKTIEVVTKYVETVKVVKEKGEAIREQVPVYITKEDNARCIIPDGFIVMHDSAVQNTVPETSRNSNEGPSGIELSKATEVIVENYNKYHEVVEQLRALQEWVKEMENNYNNK